jgi:DNA-binding FadR family transcriptional regulator
MTQPNLARHPPLSSSVPDAVFEKLLADIVGGAYLRGARLPPERDIADGLGASRASVRNALRRLEDWHLIAIRRGSGAVVRPRTEWTFEALPACLRCANPVDGTSASDLIRGALALRRSIVIGMVQLAAGRIVPGGLTAARAAVAEAWRRRGDVEKFAALDLEVMQRVLEAARMFPAIWLLNKIAPIYVESVRAIGARAAAPSSYVESHRRVFDVLEKGDGRRATSLMQQYLEEADGKRLAALRRT